MSETVTIEVHEFGALLVQAGITDAERWPEPIRDGAALLGRIRAIETQCAEQNGSWDFELLPEELQDEYDSACIALNRLIDPGDPVPWAEVKRRLGLAG